MKPTITILDYLWSGRNTWLKHHEECECSFETLSADFFDNVIPFVDWCDIIVINGMVDLRQVRRTEDEWNDLYGPAAEAQQLQELLDMHMNEVSKIMTIQASKERQNGE